MNLLIFFLLAVYTLACLVLIFVILIQSGDKGGGLSSLGSSSQGLSDALGATGAEKTLNNVTTVCAVLFMVLAIILSFTVGRQEKGGLLPDETAPVQNTMPLTGAPDVGNLTEGMTVEGESAVPELTDQPPATEAPAPSAPTVPAEAE
jgi:protein translocase SecG subunit